MSENEPVVVVIETDDPAAIRAIRQQTGSAHYKVVVRISEVPELPAGLEAQKTACLRCKAPCWSDPKSTLVVFERHLCYQCYSLTVARGRDPEAPA